MMILKSQVQKSNWCCTRVSDCQGCAPRASAFERALQVCVKAMTYLVLDFLSKE
jgi:hypothetical protein